MRDQVRQSRSPLLGLEREIESRQGRRSRRQPALELLEDRRLLASLQPISNVTVPSLQGFVQPLLAASTFTDPQTFTVTSSNPDIVASIAQGPFWTVNVNYTDPTTPSNSFNGPMTFQLFQSTTVNGKTVPLTPNTVAHITEFTNDHYYTTPTTDGLSPTKLFTRITNLTTTGSNFIAQGGAPTSIGTGGNSNQPGTPFPNENLQQLAFTGTEQLAMANAGVTAAGTNDTQFFITTSNLNSILGYNYTIFGQMVSGQTILGKMVNPSIVPTNSSGQPNHNVSMTAVSLSPTNPNGVLLIDTTQAKQGETAIITVTATDTKDHTTMSADFKVTVGPYTGPTTSNLIQTINFKPFANAGSVTSTVNTRVSSSVSATNTFPVSSATVPISFTLVSQPAHGVISNFNPSTGDFNYTPAPGFTGADTFQFTATAAGPNNGTNNTLGAAPATSKPATETILIGTGMIQVVGTVLLVTPPPRTDHGTNHIEVAQIPSSTAAGGAIIQVMINGHVDATQPEAGNLSQIVIFGGRHVRNDVFVAPSVTVNTTITSGHAKGSFLTGGGGNTTEQAWFGHATLVGGPGSNYLIGRAGQVRFRPSTATRLIFAGVPHRRTSELHPVPPSGTFYKFINHKLIPLSDVIKADEARQQHAKSNRTHNHK
jgi:cyclophilin family peptidyl-prolyl cis-trans isomerase